MDKGFRTAPLAVLVVEDDPLLLMDAMDLAEEAGMRAYGARNSSAALALMERHGAIAILFTDIQMPGTPDGLALAHTVKARWPHVTILVTSGHRDVAEADMPEGGLFLAKPYSPARVMRILGEMSRHSASPAPRESDASICH